MTNLSLGTKVTIYISGLGRFTGTTIDTSGKELTKNSTMAISLKKGGWISFNSSEIRKVY